jgi:5-formyltetrahydrofolate cyclo-ligase
MESPGSDLNTWRQAQRNLLLERRKALTRSERARCEAAVTQLLMKQAPELAKASVGFYWPFRGELDLRGLAKSLHESGARLSLPVVVEKARPLEFWQWQPGAKLNPGVWRIPVPAERAPENPTILIVPLLGFDEAGFRLGYGGGYYDRTLAAMQPRPFTIGAGYELGRLPTIYPQPHDIPMDVIVTEAGMTRFDSARGPAIEEKLDAALEATFPASDPFSLL